MVTERHRQLVERSGPFRLNLTTGLIPLLTTRFSVKTALGVFLLPLVANLPG